MDFHNTWTFKTSGHSAHSFSVSYKHRLLMVWAAPSSYTKSVITKITEPMDTYSLPWTEDQL
jgi:hypothetical protein